MILLQPKNYFLILFFALSISCSNKKKEADFYFWRTSFDLSTPEKEALKNFHTKKLYTRFFDVDVQSDSIVPLGVLNGMANYADSAEIVPVVFITNRTFLSPASRNVQLLASRILAKINSIGENYKFSEIQFDCDWSEQTKDSYFAFLKEVRKISGEKIKLSSTVRLHQVKYKERTGVPPVDEAMIMFYNIGNVKNDNSKNSIFNVSDADRYVSYLKSYPLDHSISLPIFGWIAQYREGKLIQLHAKENKIDLTDSLKFTLKKANHYSVLSSHLVNGFYLKEGDVLKKEQMDPNELTNAAQKISVNCNAHFNRIVFFDLDEYNLNTFSNEQLEETMSVFN
jgi:hypothetical protein